jgi:phage baseplate assembly protein W
MSMPNNAPPTRAFLGTGWKFPIRVDKTGGLAYSSGEQNVAESIWIILATAPGERQMFPDYGCGIQDLVFAPINAITLGNIAHSVRKALTDNEPRIDVLDVQVDAAQDQPSKILIRVDYRLRSTNSFHNMVYPFFIQEGQGS